MKFSAAVSLAMAFGLFAALAQIESGATAEGSLVVAVAAGLRAPAEHAAKAYFEETGQRIELRYGASEDLLARTSAPAGVDPTDLFLPADESYVHTANDRRLVNETWILGGMRAVVLTSTEIHTWNDLLLPDIRVALGQPGSAIGKLTRERLEVSGLWRELMPRIVETGTVTESANAAKVKAVPAAIVWNVVARTYPQLKTVELPELVDCRATVRLATLKQSRRPQEAEDFARYLADPQRGGRFFRQAGLEPPEGDR